MSARGESAAASPQAAMPPSESASEGRGYEFDSSSVVNESSDGPGLAKVSQAAFRDRPAKTAVPTAPVTSLQRKLKPAGASGPSAKEPAAGSEAGPDVKATRAPLLIYKADIVLAVFEVNKGLDAVEKIARDADGYLVARRDNSITVRVPAAGFDSSLQALLKLGDVLQRNLQVDDVTAQMNDLTTRLKNAEAMRERLEQLLKTANSTDEALKVEEQLGRVTGEIESIKGKIRLMSELISFSTMTVTFRAAATEKVNSKFKLPFPWLDNLGLSRLMSL